MKRADASASAAVQVRSLEKRINKAHLKHEILWNAASSIGEGRYSVYAFIRENELKYSVRLMAEALGINRAAYHKWKKNPVSEIQKSRTEMKRKIALVFFARERRYGSERIAAELQHAGHAIAASTVRKYMRELGLCAKGKKEL